MNNIVDEKPIKIRESTLTLPVPTVGNIIKETQVGSDKGYYVIQFKKSLTRREQERLKSTYKLKLKYYIPDYAYIESIDEGLFKKLLNEELCRSISDYLPSFKHSNYIYELITRYEISNGTGGIRMMVILFWDVDIPATIEKISRICLIQPSYNESPYEDLPRLGVVVRNLIEFENLININEVYTVCGPEQVRLNDGSTNFTLQSGFVGCTPIWDAGLHGEGQIIGIMDFGMDIAHCFFKDNIDNTIRPEHRKVVGFRSKSDIVSRDHGTFVAGIAVGDDANNSGTHTNRGIAWKSRMTFTDYLDRDQRDNTKSMFALLHEQMNDGAFIYNNSWQETFIDPATPQYSSISYDVDKFTWENGYSIVVASGSFTGMTLGPPGSSKNALCVAAAREYPNQMSIGDGASGPTTDGRRKPEITAPGCKIFSSIYDTACDVSEISTCATSWAAPVVSGALALIRQYYVDGFYPSGSQNSSHSLRPSGALLKATVINCSIDMTGVPGYPNNIEGWGLVRLNNVLYFYGNTRKLRIFDVKNIDGICSGEKEQYYIEVMTGVKPLKVTLVFNDPPPAFPDVLYPVVNNLDLKAISPNDTIYLGNVFTDGISSSGGTSDLVNNVEMILLPNPLPGKWTIEVIGTAVNVCDPGQGFAVVVTGDIREPASETLS